MITNIFPQISYNSYSQWYFLKESVKYLEICNTMELEMGIRYNNKNGDVENNVATHSM